MTVAEYIQNLLFIEEYAFSHKELMAHCEKGKVALTRELLRLEAKHKVVNLRKEFFMVIPAGDTLTLVDL